MTDDANTTPEPDERERYVQEREESDGNVEPSDDSERTVGRRPGDGTPEGVEIPDNADVPPGSKPEPRNDRDDGAQDDGSDRVADDDYEAGDNERRDTKRG